MFSNELDIIVMYERCAPTNPDHRKESLFEVYMNVMVSAEHPLVSEDTSCCLWKKSAGPITEQYVKALLKEYQYAKL